MRTTAGPVAGRTACPLAIAVSPILSARIRAADLERIQAAAPGSRIVNLSVEGLADGPVDDVEVLLRGWLVAEAFDRLLARAPHLTLGPLGDVRRRARADAAPRWPATCSSPTPAASSRARSPSTCC